MIFQSVAEEDRKVIQDMLANPKKMFELAKTNPELFEEYEEKIYRLARQGEAMMQQYATQT
ncbi:MAG: hypothetical protein IJU37_06040 [Desulfovibrio sp.]|nr:hypothetical protein [Desulfovibrio sp.]